MQILDRWKSAAPSTTVLWKSAAPTTVLWNSAAPTTVRWKSAAPTTVLWKSAFGCPYYCTVQLDRIIAELLHLHKSYINISNKINISNALHCHAWLTRKTCLFMRLLLNNAQSCIEIISSHEIFFFNFVTWTKPTRILPFVCLAVHVILSLSVLYYSVSFAFFLFFLALGDGKGTEGWQRLLNYRKSSL